MVAKKDQKDAVAQGNEDAANSDQFSPRAVNNPYWQTGDVSTDGQGFASRIENVVPAFDQAKADALEQAVTEVGEDGDNEHVVLPEDNDKKTNDEAVADLKDSAKSARKTADARAEGESVNDLDKK